MMADPTPEEWDRMKKEDKRLEAQEVQAAIDDANREMNQVDKKKLVKIARV